MNEIRLTGRADLSAMLARRKDVRALEQLLVVIGLVALNLVEDVFEADHGKRQDSSWQWAVGSRTFSRPVFCQLPTAHCQLPPSGLPLAHPFTESAVRVDAAN